MFDVRFGHLALKVAAGAAVGEADGLPWEEGRREKKISAGSKGNYPELPPPSPPPPPPQPSGSDFNLLIPVLMQFKRQKTRGGN